MEPEVTKLLPSEYDPVDCIKESAMLSIAISLKRIADAISGVPYDSAPGADNSKHRLDITSGIMLAIEQGMLAAKNG